MLGRGTTLRPGGRRRGSAGVRAPVEGPVGPRGRAGGTSAYAGEPSSVHGVTGTLVRPLLPRVTVLEAWTAFDRPEHVDAEVILMAYAPVPPRSEVLSRPTAPQPLAKEGAVAGLCVSYPLAKVPGGAKEPLLCSIR